MSFASLGFRLRIVKDDIKEDRHVAQSLIARQHRSAGIA
jgi:hypothetical protein